MDHSWLQRQSLPGTPLSQRRQDCVEREVSRGSQCCHRELCTARGRWGGRALQTRAGAAAGSLPGGVPGPAECSHEGRTTRGAAEGGALPSSGSGCPTWGKEAESPQTGPVYCRAAARTPGLPSGQLPGANTSRHRRGHRHGLPHGEPQPQTGWEEGWGLSSVGSSGRPLSSPFQPQAPASCPLGSRNPRGHRHVSPHLASHRWLC